MLGLKYLKTKFILVYFLKDKKHLHKEVLQQAGNPCAAAKTYDVKLKKLILQSFLRQNFHGVLMLSKDFRVKSSVNKRCGSML